LESSNISGNVNNCYVQIPVFKDIYLSGSYVGSFSTLTNSGNINDWDTTTYGVMSVGTGSAQNDYIDVFASFW